MIDAAAAAVALPTLLLPAVAQFSWLLLVVPYAYLMASSQVASNTLTTCEESRVRAVSGQLGQ